MNGPLSGSPQPPWMAIRSLSLSAVPSLLGLARPPHALPVPSLRRDPRTSFAVASSIHRTTGMWCRSHLDDEPMRSEDFVLAAREVRAPDEDTRPSSWRKRSIALSPPFGCATVSFGTAEK